jgi:hypothetical protein
MNNRDLYDELISRTVDRKSITPQKSLIKMLRILEQFLANWGWFDEEN